LAHPALEGVAGMDKLAPQVNFGFASQQLGLVLGV
jgi:hypothetical protein